MTTVKDPITTEVVRHSLETIAEEMRTSLYRTAMTSVVKDMLDYSCALFDPRGRLLATAIDIPTLLASMGPALRALIDKWGEDINRGDVLLMNHPYMGGVHTSDVNIFVPVFDGSDRLVGFSGTVAHHADWGGRLPGTCAASNQSVFEEGVMYPAIKLEEGGRRNEAVYDIIGANVRNPTMNLGDIRAQIAAARTGERRLAVLAERHGSEEFLEIVDGLIAYAAARTRQRIGELADGVYEAEGFLDNDGRKFDEPVRVHARITISGESLSVDLSGSAQQRVSGMNCPYSTTISDIHYAVRCVQSADVPFNEGCLEPVTLEVPKGNLFNPEFPAATSDRHLTSERLCDVLTRALVQAAPETGSAGWFSGYPVFIPETRSPKTGQRVVLLAQVSGGAGATSGHDGGDALDVHASNCAIIPAETVEMNYSIRVERYELQTDSGGAGKQRGGLGIRADYRVLGDEPVFCISESEQSDARFAAPGLDDGLAGRSASIHLLRDGEEPVPVQSKGEFVVQPGEVVSMRAGGGGGVGDPRSRDRAEVAADVRAGRVSAQAAAEVYGLAEVTT
ncbi:hydantoinase B/oxoprolinase family protein [Conexibacter sp. JD483]|uniref:hydantoinase B/oxoprolinase family protein n=1 Tax=unclassified Conexibacter TaxID=2627773 RepID=UPI00271B4419|nr:MULTISPECIES: hydantoinase B/oxoprolinase family protein [unclassified Conexibacter]MDO8185567.1 hydantoinase B/oxoprolinase family protein [Conexibacter sp. CPCC 205706]MDO8197246.1 hydantoinase B/oxoprolinase family protein [Conexibacter sp. CPCC 205762]MDR9371527.1 hydantoinase B/oxoprolinase family protein [Conexibacter sp. JD483]